MTDASKQNLIGYLINAIEDDEAEQVADELRSDDKLRSDCCILKRGFDLLAADEEPHEPPANLAAKTCDSIWALVDAPPPLRSSTDLPVDSSGERRVHPDYMSDAAANEDIENYPLLNSIKPSSAENERELVGAGASGAGFLANAITNNAPRNADPVRPVSGDSLGISAGAGGRTVWRWRPIDLIVSGCIVVVLGAIAMPTIVHQRELSRRAYCGNNLKENGIALAKYSDINRGLLPSATESGPLSAAGAYGPLIKQAGLVNDSSQVLCPSTDIPGIDATGSSKSCGTNSGFQIPSLEQLNRMTGPALTNMQKMMGGNYAYALPYRINGQLQPLKNLHRSKYALMGDHPTSEHKTMGHKSTGGRHGEVGQNVLFEDGHCEFKAECEECTRHDHFYLNDDGRDSAGKHSNDAVLVESGKGP